MNSKRGFKRITFALAAVAALSGTVIGVSIVINEYENAGWYDVIPDNYSGNEPPFEMIGTIDGDRWHKMSDLEKIEANQAYNIKSRNELESGFWIQLSKPSLVALCVAGGLVGAFIGFSSAWFILWFGGLAIYKIIRWTILGFCDDVSSKQVESMEAG